MAKLETLRLGLTPEEVGAVRTRLGREPTEVEWSIIDAEWSEHCSYKSSRALLKQFPVSGKRVLVGPGYDAGVLDIGGGLVATVHIESHNHPSAIDPYGGAATGIGGVLRDILSMGTRPIALVDVLRFGRIDRSSHSQWLMRNVVRGIADYGNCISGEDLVYFTNSSTFHVATARSLYDELTSSGKVSTEFSREDLTITKPKVDLRVLSFDFQKNTARFCKVSRLYHAKVNRLVRIRTALGRTISVTPDHPMFVVANGAIRTKQAKDLRVGDSLPVSCDFPFSEEGMSEGTYEIDLIGELSSRGNVDRITVTPKGVRLQEMRAELDPLLREAGISPSQRSHFFSSNYMPLKVYLALEAMGSCPLARRDLLLYPRRGRVSKVPSVIKVDSEFSRLVGYFLSEGCRHDETGGKNGGKTSRLIWTFRTDETEYIDDLCAILRKTGIRYGKRPTPTNTIQVKVSSRILGWLFREVLAAGRNSYTMQIPSLFYRLSPKLSFEVLKGILRGDGSIKTRSSSISLRFGTCSAVLFQQVLLLLQSLGFIPSTSTRFHTGGTVPFHELEICGRLRVESLKEMFSGDILFRARRRLAQYSQPSMEHYRSRHYDKFATVKIIKIDELAGNFGVYNFEVDGTHNYVTSGGIVTHNCVGIPTVAGEVEFDDSFERNCLVDVACVGIGKKEQLVFGEAKVVGDLLVLAGGSTGRDGMRGATFASKNLAEDSESERSSVQVPDPFMKKLMLDALLEIIGRKLTDGMKDLGGGGLSSALSELGSKGGTGMEVELSKVILREADMTATEVMISESQERMMLVLSPRKIEEVFRVLTKYGVPYSVIGEVRDHGMLRVKENNLVVADLPIDLVVNPPLISWPAKKPAYLTRSGMHLPAAPKSLGKVLLRLLGSPGIASKRWVYEQYDHEVGVRTVTKPGRGDAAVMRLPNGNFLAIKADGNSKATYLDPYSGAAGTVSEACRNVVAVGAEPMAMVDHLQVGDPADPGVFWAFSEMIRGMADYCKGTGLPVVGGKVSFYNEDQSTKRAIKPSPVVLVVGLVEGMAQPVQSNFKRDGERIVLVGETLRELGGSDYYEYIHEFTGGASPGVNPSRDRKLFKSIHRLMRSGWITAAHDCSSGGIAAALAEMCIWGGMGATVEADRIPSSRVAFDELLFSESHGRFILTAPSNQAAKLVEEFSRARIPHSVVGEVGGTKLRISSRSIGMISVGVEEMSDSWARSLARVLGD